MLSQIKALCRRTGSQLALAFIAGASTALAFAPYSIWAIYPIALAFALWHSRQLSPKASFYYWLSFGFGSFAIGISWVHVSMSRFGGLPLVASIGLMALLAFYLALYPAFAGYVSQKLNNKLPTSLCSLSWRNLVIFPAAWTLSEWMRGWVLTGFPWIWAGYSQTEGPLAPLASVIGALGLSFVIALIAGALALLLERSSPKSWLAAALALPLLTLTTYIAPKLSPVTPTGESVNVVLVQGNIAQSMKWQPEALWPTMLKYMDLSRPKFDADIIIWPEAAIPAPVEMVHDFLDNANRAANLNDSAIVTGIISHIDGTFYNSLIVLGNHNQAQQQSADYTVNGNNEFKKHHLLPIGEFVPFESLLRPLAPFFNLPMSSFGRGDYQQVNLSALGHKLAPAICFEIAFPEQLRANVYHDTDLLLTVSNDAWFGESNGPLQHMEIAQMRAIELGKPLLRGTNNGVTGIVDPTGKITDSLPQFETGVLSATVPLYQGETLFYQWGQTPILSLSGLLLAIALIRRKRVR